MNILAIVGSPHGMAGNTGRMLASFISGAESAGAQVTTISLADVAIAPCNGCDVCHRVGKCAIDDDFQDVLAAMLDADGIVLASPNYIFSVSAQMKALFDRMCGSVHLMALEGKYGTAVVTAGGGGCEEVEDYILRFLTMVGCWNVGSVGAEAFKLFDESMAPQALKEAEELGAKLAAAVQAGEPIASPALDEFREMMKQLVTMQQEHWPYEYEQWQAAGKL